MVDHLVNHKFTILTQPLIRWADLHNYTSTLFLNKTLCLCHLSSESLWVTPELWICNSRSNMLSKGNFLDSFVFQCKDLHYNKLQLCVSHHWIRRKKRKTRLTWTNISCSPLEFFSKQNKMPYHIWYLFHRIVICFFFFYVLNVWCPYWE